MTNTKQLSDAWACVRNVQKDVAALREVSAMDKGVATAVLERLNTRLMRLDKWRSNLKFLEDVPGLRTPKWYTVEIPFSYGDTDSKSGEVIISNEGPFVCTQVQAYYLITDTDTSHYAPQTASSPTPSTTAAGRTIAPTAFFSTMGWGRLPVIQSDFSNLFYLFSSYTSTGVPPVLRRGNGWNLPDFDVQIEVAGSARYWAGEPIPAAALYGVVNPEYTGISGVVQQTDRLVVRAYPTTNTVNLTGTLQVVFHGCQIQGNIDITQFTA